MAISEVAKPKILLDKDIMARAMKGFFHQRAPKPKHASIWDVDVVLRFLESMTISNLKDRTLKTVMLLALCSPKRVSEISRFSISRCQQFSDQWIFSIDKAKNRRLGPEHTAIFERFPDSPSLCPLENLTLYLSETETLRGNEDLLFVATKSPHKAVSSSTIARWIKSVLQMAGIVGYSAHSTRAASTSRAITIGLSAAHVMAAANWKSQHTFEKFYHKKIDESFQNGVLNSS